MPSWITWIHAFAAPVYLSCELIKGPPLQGQKKHLEDLRQALLVLLDWPCSILSDIMLNATTSRVQQMT